MSTVKLLTLLIFPIVLMSCQKDGGADLNNPISETVGFNNVDERLWSYFETFEHEATLRDIEIDLRVLQIKGRILEIEESGIAGTCQFRSNLPGLITVDESFWDNSNSLFKEFIVFHELGHCALYRDHEEASDQDGRCLSIMRSGHGACRDNYRELTRSYYLDELFSIKGGL